MLFVPPQRRERRWENRKHQADPQVPVGHEPALPGGLVQRQDVTCGGGAAGEQVTINVVCGLLFSDGDSLIGRLFVAWLMILLLRHSTVPSWRPLEMPRPSTTTTPAALGSLSSCVSARRATSREAESLTVSFITQSVLSGCHFLSSAYFLPRLNMQEGST